MCMWRQLSWEQVFLRAQQCGDRQRQLDLKDNIRSIVQSRGLPHKTLEDIVLIFPYVLVSKRL